MYQKYRFMCVILQTLYISTCLCASTICTEYDTNWQPAPSTEYIKTRYGHYAQMTCCVIESQLTCVTWYKFCNDTNAWTILTERNSGFLFLEQNQVIIIRSANFDDAGKYKCVPQKNGASENKLEKHVDLEVVPCDSLARGPFAIAPLPCSKTETELGATVVLPCTGYFGCGDSGDMRIVQWLVTDQGKDEWREITDGEGRYVQSPFHRNDGVMGNNLTIYRITDDDLNKQFMCILYSTQSIDGQTQLTTSLLKRGDSLLTETASFSIIGLIVAVVFTTVIIAISMPICCYKKVRKEQNEGNRRNVSIHNRTDHVTKNILDASENRDGCVTTSLEENLI